jgi:GNAT superfamily N-acetyltransferase
MTVTSSPRRRLTIRPLTPDLWPALEDLFGAHGACNGCWCMYWRIGNGYTRRPRERNRADFQSIVRRGPPPGLLAFDGETPVGWCQLTPRAVLPALESNPRYPRVDDRPVWSISCFYVRRGHRRRGVSSRLIAAAVKVARDAGAPALEAYPVDGPLPGYTGGASTFAHAGFRTVVDRNPRRPVMRRELSRRTRSRPSS